MHVYHANEPVNVIPYPPMGEMTDVGMMSNTVNKVDPSMATLLRLLKL